MKSLNILNILNSVRHSIAGNKTAVSLIFASVLALALLGFYQPAVAGQAGQSDPAAPSAPQATCPAGGQCFTDVPPGSPFYEFANNLYMQDIVTGYACGGPGEPCDAQNRPYYRPGNAVTRAQMTKFVDLARKQPGIAVRTTSNATPGDLAPLSSWTHLYDSVAISATQTNISSTMPAVFGATLSRGTPVFIFRTGGVGVKGVISDTNPGTFSAGVLGQNMGTGGAGIGVHGSHGGTGWGVYGFSPAGRGVYGLSTTDVGVVGVHDAISGTLPGVHGETDSEAANAVGMLGLVDTTSPGAASAGVKGHSLGTGGLGIGVWGQHDGGGWGVYGRTENGGSAVRGFTADPTGNWAGYFQGNVNVTGSCCGAIDGTFQMDHPLDPANKTLDYSSVASPDRMNVMNGNVTTNANGEATVTLPDHFSKLNRDFRYQLTVLGQFAQAIVASELKDGSFTIKTDKPSVKVSWQVTGIRDDPWARAHPMAVERDKPAEQRGLYRHPQLYGQPMTKSIEPDYLLSTTSPTTESLQDEQSPDSK